MTSIATRQSLLSRLRDSSQDDAWYVFFETYWELIYGAARKKGLSPSEAEDVVQETLVSVVRSIKDFKYDQSRGSFRGWLLQLTNWKIIDQMRRRPTTVPFADESEHFDPGMTSYWDQEWKKHLLEQAVSRVKIRAGPKTYQLFHTSVLLGKGAKETAKILKCSVAAVHMAAFKVKTMIRQEILRLEQGELKQMLPKASWISNGTRVIPSEKFVRS